MASLKSYISTLLSSFHDSHKSVPSAQRIDSQLSIDKGQSKIYTAPCDGFLTVKSDQSNFLVLRDERGTDVISTDVTDGGSLCVTSMPMRKGTVAYGYTPSTTTLSMYFRRAVGA